MQTNTCPAFNGFIPVNGVARRRQFVTTNTANGEPKIINAEERRAEIVEAIFDECAPHDYVETLSGMMQHYLFNPTAEGLHTPAQAKKVTHLVGRLLSHLTALAETVE
jgi:hypothetical protein